MTFDQVRTGCVVDYRAGAARPYRVVETAPDGSRPRGPAVWQRAFDIEPTGATARLPVRIYEANQAEGRESACQCQIHYDAVRVTEGSPGFVRRLQALAKRAGWSVVPTNPTYVLLKPTGRERSSTAESVVKGVKRAADLENVEIKVSRHGADIGVQADFSEAIAEGLLQPRPVSEPDTSTEVDVMAKTVKLIESMGWSVRARLSGEWWIVPERGNTSAESVAARLGVEILRAAPEGVWISAP